MTRSKPWLALLSMVFGLAACGGSGKTPQARDAAQPLPLDSGSDPAPTTQDAGAAGADAMSGHVDAGGLGFDAGLSDASAPSDAATSDASVSGPTFPKACADLYDDATLPSFELTFVEGVWEAMLTNCDRDYHPAQLHYGSETVDVMVRNKGNWSFSCDKPQLVISFNEVDKNARFHGLRKLVLDAPWYDHTVLHERLAFYFLGRYGVPASCVNNARLSINGSYFGLYSNVERLDREYLERNFADEDGDLWKAGQELETNKSTGTRAHVDAFWSATSLAELEAVMDLEQAVEVWAGQAMLPDRDSYWAGVEINFYLYDHPGQGLIFLPYDADLSFSSQAETGEHLDQNKAEADPIYFEHDGWGREEAVRIVLSDTYYCGRFVEALTRAHAAYDVTAMQERLATWAAQIAPSLAEDVERGFSDEQHAEALDYVHTLIADRAAFVGEWLKTEHCPAMFPAPAPPATP